MEPLDVSKYKRVPKDSFITGGSFWLLSEARYLGKIPYTTKSGRIRAFYYLAVLFYRITKTGKPATRVRILTMSGKPESEFNRFLSAIENQTIDVNVDSDTLGPVLAERINSQTINARIVFDNQGCVPTIKQISRLKDIYIKRDAQSTIWPNYILKKYSDKLFPVKTLSSPPAPKIAELLKDDPLSELDEQEEAEFQSTYAAQEED